MSVGCLTFESKNLYEVDISFSDIHAGLMVDMFSKDNEDPYEMVMTMSEVILLRDYLNKYISKYPGLVEELK